MRLAIVLMVMIITACGSPKSKKDSSPNPENPPVGNNNQTEKHQGNQNNEVNRSEKPIYYGFLTRCLSDALEIQHNSGNILRATWTCSATQSSENQPQLLNRLNKWGDENCPHIVEVRDAVQYKGCVIKANRPVEFISESRSEIEDARGYGTNCGEIDNYRVGDLICTPQ